MKTNSLLVSRIASLVAVLILAMLVLPDSNRVSSKEKDDPECVQSIKIEGGEGKFVKAAITSNGKWLAVNNQKKVVLFQLIKSHAKESFSLEIPENWCLAFSPDGTRLAIGGDEITIFDMEKRQTIGTLKADFGRVNALAFAADGLVLLSGDMKGNILAWDLKTNKKKGVIAAFMWQVLAIGIEKRTAAVGVFGGPATVWDIVDSKEIKSFGGLINVSSSLAFSPDGDRLAVSFTNFKKAGAAPDPFKSNTPNLIRVFSAPNWMPMGELDGHIETINSISFSPDGKLLASGGCDKKIKIWDLATSKMLYEWKAHGNWVTTVIWLSEGREILSAGLDGKVNIWRLQPKAER